MNSSSIFLGGRWVIGGLLAGATAAAPALLLAQQRTAAPASTQKPASLAAVRSVSHTRLPRGERITVELTNEVRYTFNQLPNPDRVYFDFDDSTVAASVITAARTLGGGPLVASIRIARHSERTTRLVLTLAAQARYSAFSLYNPFRVAIDLGTEAAGPTAPMPPAAPTVMDAPAPSSGEAPESPGVATTPAQSAVPPPPDAPVPSPPVPSLNARGSIGISSSRLPSVAPASTLPRGDYSLARQLGLRVARVVIDAGHGGHDPGAQSNGIVESELVLDVALRLEQLLKNQPGVDVVLTRRTDDFIPLEERTAIANRESADLFLSIHANASRQANTRGIETYFLNFATNPAAEAVAARENATSGRTMGNLPDLVKTIALNNKVVESRELATVVQTSMVRRLRLQNRAVKDLGVKQAPFVVLIGAQMPSVLAEIAFLTNRPEAALLKQASYRQRIAQSLSEAVLKYQASLKKATTMAVKAQER